MVDFGGWDMPLHYGSQIDEHHVVRQQAGMFDVSHMTVVDIEGTDSKSWLSRLLANDIGKLTVNGNFSQTNSGRATFEIAGRTPEAEFDQLEVAVEIE